MSPKLRWMWAATFGVIALDQGTKWLTRALLRERVDEFMLIPGWFGFTHATNRGAAFSMMEDSPHRLTFFLTFTVVAAVVIVVASRLLQTGDRWAAAGLGVLLGGTLGNGIDRAVFGQVTDMIKVAAGSGPLRDWALAQFQTNVWPIFNVADSAIWVGLGIFLLAFLFTRDAGARPLSQHEGPAESSPSLDG